jgi:cell division protein FtsL
LLEKNQDKIDWDNLSMNPNAFSLLEKDKHKIDWRCLSFNPNATSLF